MTEQSEQRRGREISVAQGGQYLGFDFVRDAEILEVSNR